MGVAGWLAGVVVFGGEGCWKPGHWELGGSLVHRFWGEMKTPPPGEPDDGVILPGDLRRRADVAGRPYRMTPVMVSLQGLGPLAPTVRTCRWISWPTGWSLKVAWAAWLLRIGRASQSGATEGSVGVAAWYS